jgi:UDP-2,4-diacetamido-2,4,6-trideoxy-beta-L-altropyranose hydrolase
MGSEKKRLLFRADAGANLGTGHVMRCLALTQAWHDAGGQAMLASAASLGGLERRLAAEGLLIERLSADPGSDEDARLTIELAKRFQARQVVIDGYQFSSRYQKLVKTAGLWSLVIDDYGHAEHYWADAVLNQNLHAREGLYRHREPGVRLLLGPQYALLRREFGKWRSWRRSHPPLARRVLVTLGGADPANATQKVIAALSRLQGEGLEAVVVVGTNNPHLPALRAALPADSSTLRLLTDVKDMAELMAWADVVVCAGGSTCWELAYMGLPALTLVLAENQVDVAAGLAVHGVAQNLGWHTTLSEATLADALSELMRNGPARRTMSARGRELADGEGGPRVVKTLMEAVA